jgi:uncharacterized protein (TIGR02246 family)
MRNGDFLAIDGWRPRARQMPVGHSTSRGIATSSILAFGAAIMWQRTVHFFGLGALVVAGCLAPCYALAQNTAGQNANIQNDPEAAAIRASEEQLVKLFNAGKADELAAMFLPKGELVDEQGIVYAGQPAIKDLLTKFFAKYPGAKLTLNIDSIRVIGPVAFEEGTRLTATKDDASASQVRFEVVRAKTPAGWQIASLRDFADDPDLTPHERLEPLAWLVGDWVNEGNDAAVRISYHWSDDKNFLLGDFQVGKQGSTVMQSTQRIGWDPLAGKVRSWLFDSDGGFGEGHWTEVDGTWVIKSSAVLPDGQTGSATVTMTPKGKDRYILKGTDRIAGDDREEDFEFVVSRRPPMPTK